jgi:hypothetical protein
MKGLFVAKSPQSGKTSTFWPAPGQFDADASVAGIEAERVNVLRQEAVGLAIGKCEPAAEHQHQPGSREQEAAVGQERLKEPAVVPHEF